MKEPVLEPLDAIECRDALVTRKPDGTYEEAKWPEAEFIVGNPPFLGGKLMRTALGSSEVDDLFGAFEDRVPREADLVTYWFEKSRAAIKSGKAKRAGLVATNSIRGGANRRVLDRIVEDARIFEAWSDEAWIVDGAAVRVSLICFGKDETAARLNRSDVAEVHTDLTAGGANLTTAKRLMENAEIAFMGDTKGGAFDVGGQLARGWLTLPTNPHGRTNADVLKPWRNGMDITRRSADKWIVDFRWDMSEREASLFEAPFHHIKDAVLPIRKDNRRETTRIFGGVTSSLVQRCGLRLVA
jgi:type II restriction/modification system DNA methylase subunit YeeA